MTEDHPGRRAKLSYEPPLVRRVTLAADEFAVAGCKQIQIAPEVCNKGGILVNKVIAS